MTQLLRYPESDATVNWSEDDLQMTVVRTLRRLGVCHAADQNAAKRSKRDGARRKVLGMVAGEADVRLYLPGGRLVMVEIKAWRGTLSDAQKARHAELRALGFDVHVLKAKTPADAVAKIIDILAIYGEDGRHGTKRLQA